MSTQKLLGGPVLSKTQGQDRTNSSPLIVEKVVLSHRAQKSTSAPWKLSESTEKSNCSCKAIVANNSIV